MCRPCWEGSNETTGQEAGRCFENPLGYGELSAGRDELEFREDITVLIEETADCDDSGAICTELGMPLSTALEVTMPYAG